MQLIISFRHKVLLYRHRLPEFHAMPSRADEKPTVRQQLEAKFE